MHSSVEFSLDYMGITTYRTDFRAVEGSLGLDPDRPAEADRQRLDPRGQRQHRGERDDGPALLARRPAMIWLT